MDDTWNQKPGRSDHNQARLPERTVTALRLHEFGPVTFPAYPGAGAGVRSITGWWYGDLEERIDPGDMSLLATAMQALTTYLGEQDDPGDEKNIPTVEKILADLVGLMDYEATEAEPSEDEDGEPEMMEATVAAVEGASAGSRTTVTGQAGTGHLTVSGRRASPLYTSKRREVESWRLR
jgi:hypothetical protein